MEERLRTIEETLLYLEHHVEALDGLLREVSDAQMRLNAELRAISDRLDGLGARIERTASEAAAADSPDDPPDEPSFLG